MSGNARWKSCCWRDNRALSTAAASPQKRGFGGSDRSVGRPVRGSSRSWTGALAEPPSSRRPPAPGGAALASHRGFLLTQRRHLELVDVFVSRVDVAERAPLLIKAGAKVSVMTFSLRRPEHRSCSPTDTSPLGWFLRGRKAVCCTCAFRQSSGLYKARDHAAGLPENGARTQLSAAFHFSEAATELHLSMAQMRTLRAPSYVSVSCRNQPEAMSALRH